MATKRKPHIPLCLMDHGGFTMLDMTVSSLAHATIFNKILSHYKEVKLSDEQIKKILDIRLAYEKEFVKLIIKFTNTRSKIGKLSNQITTKKDKKIIQLLHEHQKIFQQHEYLFIKAVKQIEKIVSLKQLRKLAEIYSESKRKLYHQVYGSITDELGGVYKLKKVRG